MTVDFPLEGVNPSDPLLGGYGFCDLSGNTFHPGLDLNTPGGAQSDCGTAVRWTPAVAGTVRFAGWQPPKGFGNHVWVETDGGDWVHFCHLQGVQVAEGARLAAGDTIGQCGNTGGWPFCHLHFEVMRARPPSWIYWPSGQTQAQVRALYYDPAEWLDGQHVIVEDDEAMLTPPEKEALQLLRGLGWSRESIETAVNRIGRAVEIGRRLQAPKVSTKERKQYGDEMSHWGS